METGDRTIRTTHRPVLLTMRGGPGSGKSTLARDLGRRLGWPLIDKDDIRSLLESDDAGAIAYEAMLAVAGRQLAQGLNVICDSPLLEATYRRAAEIAAGHDGQLLVVEAFCGDEREWAARVEGRKQDGLPGHRTTDIDQARQFYREPGKAEYPVGHQHLRVDTARERDETLDDVLAWLRDMGIAR